LVTRAGWQTAGGGEGVCGKVACVWGLRWCLRAARLCRRRSRHRHPRHRHRHRHQVPGGSGPACRPRPAPLRPVAAAVAAARGYWADWAEVRRGEGGACTGRDSGIRRAHVRRMDGSPRVRVSQVSWRVRTRMGFVGTHSPRPTGGTGTGPIRVGLERMCVGGWVQWQSCQVREAGERSKGHNLWGWRGVTRMAQDGGGSWR
jgi:hypothetical protein